MMSGLNETPRANRVHIAFFGLRNAGKSTLVNAFTGQRLAIVSDTPGTTTDPVSKAMEILPLGPCLVTDTAGLDDIGELGAQRVAKSLAVLATTDVAVWVWGDGRAAEDVGPYHASSVGPDVPAGRAYGDFLDACAKHKIAVLEFRRGDSVEALKEKIAGLKLADDTPGLLDGVVHTGDHVICVCPIDESAPKGRLILPQVQAIRDCLDRHLACTVCQPGELSGALGREVSGSMGRVLVITDSQAFGEVKAVLSRTSARSSNLALTSFSVLFARQKGDLAAYAHGLAALHRLKDGDTVLVAEGCTHHRQCNDIGSVKIPKALAKLTGRDLKFEFASGGGFLESRSGRLTHGDGSASSPDSLPPPDLIVQCGGCMLTRREVLRRISVARVAGIPIVNYGMVLGLAAGLPMEELSSSPILPLSNR